jgi:hypothetical protein
MHVTPRPVIIEGDRLAEWSSNLNLYQPVPLLATPPIRLVVNNHNMLLYTTNFIACLQYNFMPRRINAKTPLSKLIHEQMQERGVSVHQLAIATRVGYERARTAATGDEPPSQRLLEEICRFLQLDFKVANEMLITEQMKRRYGRLPSGLGDRDPELQAIEENWQLLSPDEREHIAWLVSRYAERRDRTHQTPKLHRMGPRPVRKP